MKRKLLKIFLPVILCAAASVVTESRVCPINFGTLVYAGESENIEAGIEISQLAAPSGVLAPGSAFGISGVIDNSAGEFTRIYGGIYKSDSFIFVSSASKAQFIKCVTAFCGRYASKILRR